MKREHAKGVSRRHCSADMLSEWSFKLFTRPKSWCASGESAPGVHGISGFCWACQRATSITITIFPWFPILHLLLSRWTLFLFALLKETWQYLIGANQKAPSAITNLDLETFGISYAERLTTRTATRNKTRSCGTPAITTQSDGRTFRNNELLRTVTSQQVEQNKRKKKALLLCNRIIECTNCFVTE